MTSATRNAATVRRFQPRYVAYAAAHGRSPEGQRDAERGNHEFMCWINQRWREFDAKYGLQRGGHRDQEQHTRFDRWLKAQYLEHA